ncbi:MAG: glucose-1-phosphate adenylyltransferase subunit GlgD [Clostridia bacterium]|nr:glucose-1-phosphate adenylyltransferase subunit GlgD [Clostridia bacterium]
MTVAGLIFANIHDACLPELTARRTMASVPFGCRYRLIDFPLSNMVNSGISKVGVIAHDNYQSLMDHIGTGKDWDLARRSGGIKILPPFITSYTSTTAQRLYTTRLEALIGVTNFISKSTEDCIVLSDCDTICNINLSDVIAQHERTGADITIVTREFEPSEKFRPEDVYSVSSDSNNVITDISAYNANEYRSSEISTNIMVINRIYLLGLVNDAASRGYIDFYRDVLSKILQRGTVYAYHYKGFFLKITSLESYFASSMKLLGEDARTGLTSVEGRPIHTKVRNSAPTLYKEGSKVANSYIADGCEIEGVVENSIIFRGVKVGKGAVVRNSILLQDTFVGDNVQLNCVVADKDVVIKDGRNLSGHTTMPFFVSKGTIV